MNPRKSSGKKKQKRVDDGKEYDSACEGDKEPYVYREYSTDEGSDHNDDYAESTTFSDKDE